MNQDLTSTTHPTVDITTDYQEALAEYKYLHCKDLYSQIVSVFGFPLEISMDEELDGPLLLRHGFRIMTSQNELEFNLELIRAGNRCGFAKSCMRNELDVLGNAWCSYHDASNEGIEISFTEFLKNFPRTQSYFQRSLV